MAIYNEAHKHEQESLQIILKNAINEKYSNSEIELLGYGWQNFIYKLTKENDEMQIIRVSRSQKRNGQRINEQKYLKLFCETQATPKLIGKGNIEIENADGNLEVRDYTICEFIEGDSFDSKPLLTEENISNFALSLSKLHDTKNEIQTIQNILHNDSNQDYLAELKDNVDKYIPEQLQKIFLTIIEVLLSKYNKLQRISTKENPIHADIKPANCILSSSGKVTFIDLDSCRDGFIEEDIAAFFGNFMLNNYEIKLFMDSYIFKDRLNLELLEVKYITSYFCALFGEYFWNHEKNPEIDKYFLEKLDYLVKRLKVSENLIPNLSNKIKMVRGKTN
jgi:Ser/Thr protein kinase RdoA (MazF antagonist)